MKNCFLKFYVIPAPSWLQCKLMICPVVQPLITYSTFSLRRCPNLLACLLARSLLDSISKNDLKKYLKSNDDSKEDPGNGYFSLNLKGTITSIYTLQYTFDCMTCMFENNFFLFFYFPCIMFLKSRLAIIIIISLIILIICDYYN